MEVGEVRVADDRDFRRFLSLAEDTEGWLSKFNKNDTRVWVKIPQAGSVNEKSRLLKTVKIMDDISAATCYDVLHDPHFRAEWDTTMLEGKEVYMLNHNNDISYYAVKVPAPLKNRDFIMQRTWLDTPAEYIIFNHSIYHKEFPPKKGLIRGESILTGYLIRPKGRSSCELTYVTQMDPKGTVPMWAVNKVAEYLAPSVMKNLHKACLRYPAWKSVNNPHFKPWLYPEQMNLPRLKMSDVLTKNTFSSNESLEDGLIKEDDFKGGRSTTSVSPTSQQVPDNNNERVPSPKPLTNGADHSHDDNPAQSAAVNKRRPAPKEPPQPALRSAQSESSLLSHQSTVPDNTPTGPSSSQPASRPTSSQYTQNQHRSDIKVHPHSKRLQPTHRPPGHHASSPEISQGSNQERDDDHHHSNGQLHQPARREPGQPAQPGPSQQHHPGSHPPQSPGHADTHLQNGHILAADPRTSPLGFMKKKLSKWSRAARHGNSEDLRAMDYEEAQKEIMVREHEARMVAFQEELEFKRREHRARMVLMDQMRKGGMLPGSEAQQVLLHRTSSIVMNETILGTTTSNVRKDVNGYRRGGHANGEPRAIEQPNADR